MLIKRVYELDPLACPECGGQMKVVAFIDPPQVRPEDAKNGSCDFIHANMLNLDASTHRMVEQDVMRC